MSKTRLFVVVGVVLGVSVLLLTGVSAAENATGEVDDALHEKTGDTNIILDLPATPETKIQGDHEDVVSGLKRHSDTTQKPVKDRLKEMDGVKIQRSWWIKNAILVTADLDTVDPKKLAGINGVESVEPDRRVKVPEPVKTESDVEPDQGDYTYGLEQINAPDVWDEMGVTGQGVRVVVSDSGVDADHPDIKLTDDDGWTECVEPSRGSCVENNDPVDPHGHGTHVSGTVAGGDAGGTHIGVAPDVELAHARVLNENNWGYFSDWIESMQWAVQTDSDIISMSMGGDKTGTLVEPVVNTMEADTLVVASIGNDGEGTSGSPGAVWDSVSSGATDESKDVTSFSGGELIDTSSVWGNDAKAYWPEDYITPDIAAPGSAVLSAEPGGGYQRKWGTSMSAPHKTGTAALIISAAENKGKELSPYEVRDLMMETAWKPDDWDEGMAQDAIGDKDTRYGKGIIDAESAVQEVTDLSVNSGSISGKVRNSNQGLPNTVVWTREFETPESPNPDFVFEITPVGGTQALAAAATTQPDIGDEGVRNVDFEVTFNDTSTPVIDNSFIATGAELQNIDLESRLSGFNSPNVDNYTLLRFPDDDPANLGDYSMDRVPARTNPPGGVDYTRLQAVQYSTGETGNGASANPVRTGFTEDGDVVIVGAQPIESNFEVSNLNAPASALVGSQFDVNATVENTGGTDDTQDVTLSINGSTEETQSVQLDPGENTTVEFTTSVSSTGDANVEVASDDDSESTTVSVIGAGEAEATVESSSVTVGGVGETGESAITIDADNGVLVAQIDVSVDTSVAEITNVQEGADVDSSQPSQTFNLIDQTADSARIEYSNLQAQTSPIQDFELAVVEFEAQGASSTPVEVAEDGVFDGAGSEYTLIGEQEGTLTVGSFTEPLIERFEGPPTNTGRFDPTLHEDLDGDGSGTDVDQTVAVFGELIRGNDLNGGAPDGALTDEQARKLNWNQGSPETEVTPPDMVSLFGEQIRAD